MIAADLRKRRPKPCSAWHLDEVCLKIAGRMVYLWRAVDAGGEAIRQYRAPHSMLARRFLFSSRCRS